jgi:hypothetical protein
VKKSRRRLRRPYRHAPVADAFDEIALVAIGFVQPYRAGVFARDDWNIGIGPRIKGGLHAIKHLVQGTTLAVEVSASAGTVRCDSSLTLGQRGQSKRVDGQKTRLSCREELRSRAYRFSAAVLKFFFIVSCADDTLRKDRNDECSCVNVYS